MEHHFKSEKTYRYFTNGDLDKAKKLLVVMHGYGYLAQYFIRKFESLSEDYFVIAPEGMHRFYLNGVSGRVGASWMTKEDRESDIADNIHWLNELLKQFEGKHFEERILLGFSQGGATASRWYYHNQNAFNRLILWASVFPPDLTLEDELRTSNIGNNTFVIGSQDQYFEGEKLEEIKTFYKNIGFEIVQFVGPHEVNEATLRSLLNV